MLNNRFGNIYRHLGNYGLMDVAGKVILITGGGRGIGAALANSFSEAGAKVVVVSRTKAEIETVAAEVQGLAVVGDVRNADDCARVVKEAIAHFGKIDVLINNAGVAYNKPFTEHTVQEYDTIMDTNVKGVFLLTKEVIKHHPHVIITISSGAGKSAYPGLSVYCASKFAVRGLMESLSQETHAKVYTVLPGGVDTRMYHELFDARARVKPQQIADAVVSLVQEEPESGFELELYNIL
jgi:meso-butanediol dehydrogenase / (S,S)-butanediol dehydrogenase / diacetyl reductase